MATTGLQLELRTDAGQCFMSFGELSISPAGETLEGVSIVFNLKYRGTDVAEKASFEWTGLHIDVSLVSTRGSTLPLGRLVGDLDVAQTVRSWESHLHFPLQLSASAFARLIDQTHAADLLLRFQAVAVGYAQRSGAVEPVRIRGESYATIPHSDWLAFLNSSSRDRFDTIVIRTQFHQGASSTLDEAVAKLKEAQAAFAQGHWNAVGTLCRAAWRVYKTTVPRNLQGQAAEELLRAVIGDSRRRTFGEAVLKGGNQILNAATHLEGEPGSPTLYLTREDALLCLRWTAAIIEYLSVVAPSGFTAEAAVQSS